MSSHEDDYSDSSSSDFSPPSSPPPPPSSSSSTRPRGRPKKDSTTPRKSKYVKKTINKNKLDKSSKPKPLNPFMLYSLDQRPILQQENKDLSTTEISKMLGDNWRKLHPDMKKVYKKRAQEKKDEMLKESNNNSQKDDTNNNNNNNVTDSIEDDDHLTKLYHALVTANNALNTFVGL